VPAYNSGFVQAAQQHNPTLRSLTQSRKTLCPIKVDSLAILTFTEFLVHQSLNLLF